MDAEAASAANLATQLENTGKATQDLDNYTNSLNERLSNIVQTAQQAPAIMTAFTNKINELKVATSTTGTVSKSLAGDLGAVTTALIGTYKGFSNLGNIDTSFLSTFTGQWNDLVKATQGGFVDFGKFEQIAHKLAASLGKVIPAGANIPLFIGNLLKSADASLAAQNAILKMAGATGQLDNVLKAAYVSADNKMGNMNEIISSHQQMIATTGNIVNLLPDQVEKAYAQLGVIPKGLEGSMNAAGDVGARAGGQVNKLTAAILTAVGSQQDFKDVAEALRVSFREYNMETSKALQFSAQIAEVSRKTGTELEIVRRALLSSAEAFGKFNMKGEDASKITKGLSSIMNEYTQRLVSAGMGTNRAVATVQNMTKSIETMSMAQKAFLSAQTGGPGGLMGAFQLDKMMAEDPKKVFELTRQAMLQQIGPIVSAEAARTNQGAADARYGQLLMLQQSPLAKFAQNDQDAGKILDMFEAQGRGEDVQELQDNILADTMDKGLQIQDMSHTELVNIRTLIERGQAAASISSLGGIQKAGITIGMGRTLDQGEAVTPGAEERRQSMRSKSTRYAGESVTLSNRLQQINEQGKVPTGASSAQEAFQQEGMLLKDFVVKQYGDGQKLIFDTIAKITDFKKNIEDQLKTAPENRKKALQDVLKNTNAQLEDWRKKSSDNVAAARKTLGSNVPGGVGAGDKILPSFEDPDAESLTPGAVVANAARQAPGAVRAATNNTGQTTPVNNNTGGGTIVHEHKVEVTGYCVKCKQEIAGSRQIAQTVNTTQ